MADKTNINLCFVLCIVVFVHGEDCSVYTGSSSVKDKVKKLAGTGELIVEDKDKQYKYTINLCRKSPEDSVAIFQNNLTKEGPVFKIGYFDKATRAFGGGDWLILTFFGDKYHHHCGNARRKALIMIHCDRSADTTRERQPRILEEFRPDEKDAQFCYYLFEMKHDAVCPPEKKKISPAEKTKISPPEKTKISPPEKTKISPGFISIIIIVIVGLLYLLLGFLYQRFIVRAKGMEQIPNYFMWREFGSLQADGCNYMCRCKRTREPTHYKPMDDAIADDEDFKLEDDNDDTMLPM